MAEYGDVAIVKALTTNDIEKMKNAQLKQALTALINEPRHEEPSNRIILKELQSLKTAVAEAASPKKEVQTLTDRLDTAFDIIHQQQRFLETLDTKERQRNLIITGLSEDGNDLGATDDEKIRKVMDAASPNEAVDRIG